MQYQVDAKDGHGGNIGMMTCYCPECKRSFMEWIVCHYSDSIEHYNNAHGKDYSAFYRIHPPTKPASDRLLWQEWVDFHAEAIPDAISLQRRVIEREIPGALVTHEINDWYPNTWDCVYSGNNFWRMGDRLEHAFNDQYPMEWAPGSLWRIYLYAFTQEVTQSSISFEKSFWTNGQAFRSWQGDLTSPPDAGYCEQIYTALMHGANGLIWWTGSDLLPRAEQASSEMVRLVEIIGNARPLKDPIALLVPWTTHAQIRLDDHGDDLVSAYQLLIRLGYQIETLDEKQVMDGLLETRGYKALCIWGNSSLAASVCERIRDFVHKGGLLLADYGDIHTSPFGTVFPETISSEETRSLGYELSDGTYIGVKSCRQALHRKKGSEILAKFSDKSPAIARYRYGGGRLWRAGSLIGVDYAAGMGLYDWAHQERVRIEPAIEDVVAAEFEDIGLKPIAQADNRNVEIALFRVESRVMAMLVNHLVHPIDVTLSIDMSKLDADSHALLDSATNEAILGKIDNGRLKAQVKLDGMNGRALWVE